MKLKNVKDLSSKIVMLETGLLIYATKYKHYWQHEVIENLKHVVIIKTKKEEQK